MKPFSSSRFLILKLAGCAGAAASISTAAAALPPPPSVEVIAVSSDYETMVLADAYLTLLAHRGSFKRGQGSLAVERLNECSKNSEAAQDCVRNLLEASGAQGPIVIVLASKANGDSQKWTCIGTGDEPSSVERQTIALNLRTGFFGDTQPQFEQGKLASGCVIAAAAESGW